MAKYGDAVCPFTGEKFATVSDGPDGTVTVRTPIFREPVTLTRALFGDLPHYPARLKLGLRRRIANRIDLGGALDTLTDDQAVDSIGHPEPSSEAKAFRLLGWMIGERVGPRNLARKFDFTVATIGPRHEACLVTESVDREQLLGLLRRLQAFGYVEYLGDDEHVVTEPRLMVRLTDAGRANGGRLPPGRMNRTPVHSSLESIKQSVGFDFNAFRRLGRELETAATNHLGVARSTYLRELVSVAPRYAGAIVVGDVEVAFADFERLGALGRMIEGETYPESVKMRLNAYRELFESRFGQFAEFATESAQVAGGAGEPEVVRGHSGPTRRRVVTGAARSDDPTGASIAIVRTKLKASRAAVERTIAGVEEQRPNSDDEIARQKETLRRLRLTLVKLDEADAILKAGGPTEAAARPIASSLLTLLKEFDKLERTGPGMKIINTGLGLVILCTAAIFDSMGPGWAVAPVMATGVYGTGAVKTVLNGLRELVRPGSDAGAPNGQGDTP